MSQTYPELSFVVETMNLRPGEGFGALVRALAAIARQTIAPDRYEVLVAVDALRHPNLGEHLARAAPRVRVVECPGAHYYRQKNLGALAARGRVVGFVDADCDPAPGWAEAVLNAFARAGDDLCVVQGRYRTHSLETSSLAQAFLVTTFGHQAAATERRLESLAASNCAFRREEILARPFREDPVYHGPDVEKAAEIRTAGRHILLVPEAANSHDHEPGLRAMHARGVYWGYCFLKLRRDGTGNARYARLFRALGPLAPLAVVPAKAWIDVRRLGERRRDLGLGAAATVTCAAVLVANALSVGVGAARCILGLPPQREPRATERGA
jgi:glycosyltransferase involved in cell wall biosynthesis